MSDYQTAIKTAEEAVASMKDPKLKEIAFGQLLAHLLAGGKHPAPGAKREPGVPTRKASQKTPRKKSIGPIAWLRELATDGFFKTPRNAKAILEALEENSHHLGASDLTWPLQQLCHDKVLRRKKMAAEEGKAAVWHWANW